MSSQRHQYRLQRIERMKHLGLTMLMAVGEVDTADLFKTLLSSPDVMGFDDVDKRGRTPLMIACQQGYEDIVKYLIHLGANVTKTCGDKNTPLHFACMYRRFPNEPEELIKQKRILTLLIEHGATMERNSINWTPPYYAAMSAVGDLVEYFLMNDFQFSIAYTDKVNILEILGVAQTFQSDHPKIASRSFSKAINLRLEKGYPVDTEGTSDLGRLIQACELETVEDMQKANDNPLAWMFHGYLVCERTIPETYLKSLFWPTFLQHRYHGTSFRIELEVYLRLCSYVVQLESETKVEVGTAMRHVSSFLLDCPKPETREICTLCTIVDSYKAIFQTINEEKFANIQESIACNLGQITAVIVHHFATHSEELRRLLTTLGNLFQIFREKRPRFSLNDCAVVNFLLSFQNILKRKEKSERNTLIIGRSLFAELFHPDDAILTDDEGNTLLHLLMSSELTDDIVHVVLATTKLLVRYGCPVEKENAKGKTAASIALTMKHNFGSEWGLKLFSDTLALLTKSTSPLTLQEIAARVIIHRKIPYRGQVPSTLCAFIDDGYVLQEDNHQSSSNMKTQ